MAWQYSVLQHPHLHVLRVYGYFTIQILEKIKNEEDPQKRKALLLFYVEHLKTHMSKSYDKEEKENLDKLLWTHIYQLSGGNLGVSLPYSENELQDTRHIPPERIAYPKDMPFFRSYGKFVENYIDRLQQEKDKQKRHALLKNLFKVLWTWRHLYDAPNPSHEIILKDLQSLLKIKQKQIEKDLSFIEMESSMIKSLTKSYSRSKKGKKRKK